MATTPEGRVKAHIKRVLKAHGVWFTMPPANGFGKSGVPDFLCCVRGQFLAVEAKAPGKAGNTTFMQDTQIAGIHAAGGRAVVVDDAAQVESILQRIIHGSNPTDAR